MHTHKNQMTTRKLYFAGPDVFRPDLGEWRDSVKSTCRKYAIVPLLPCDNEAHDPDEIVSGNLHMIRESDGVLANLEPFRGSVEPDSGTVFEIGYAIALGKPVIGYQPNRKTVLERVREHDCGVTASGSGIFSWRDGAGYGIEDAGETVNLMIAKTVIEIINGSVADAIAEWRRNATN